MVRRDRVADPVRRDEVAQRLADGLVPVVRQIAGCLACYVVAAEEGDVLSIAVFAGRTGAEAARREAAAWVARYVAPLVAAPAEVAAGRAWGGPTSGRTPPGVPPRQTRPLARRPRPLRRRTPER
jgi:hypothetical protein